MLFPSDTFQPVTVSDLSYHSTDLSYIRHNPPSILGDRRREGTYDELYEQLLLRGQASIQQLSRSENDRQRFSRLLNNTHVKPNSMVDYACTRSVPKRCPEAIAGSERTLVISDGSNVGLNSAAGKIQAKGGLLGVLNDGSAPGLMLHASLAITARTHQVIGLADSVMFSRSKKEVDNSRHRASEGTVRPDKQLSRTEKESHAWEKGAFNSRRLLQVKGYNRRVYVHDAGSDDKIVISRLLELKAENEKASVSNSVIEEDDFVIRLRDYQRVFYRGYRRDDDHELDNIDWLDAGLVRISKGVNLTKNKLGELLQQHPCFDEIVEVEVRELKHVSKKFKKRFRAKRKAKVKIRTLKIRFRDLSGQWHSLTLVHAWENPRSLPKKQRKTAIKWVLLTSLPVNTLEQALEIIDIYRNRWHIEQLFRVLKRDGLEFATTQLANVEAIIKLMVMALEAAAAVLKLVQARDQTTGNPITEVFEKRQVQVLQLVNREYEGRTAKQKNPYPEDQLSYATWTIARMGGWKVYGSKPPGPKTIARGLKDFMRFCELALRIKDYNNEMRIMG
jgi:hypothetical protein